MASYRGTVRRPGCVPDELSMVGEEWASKSPPTSGRGTPRLCGDGVSSCGTESTDTPAGIESRCLASAGSSWPNSPAQPDQEQACSGSESPEPALRLPPGLPAPPLPPPSLGSALHSSGMCKPCAWFWKPQGCNNGQECLRCHLCPAGTLRALKAAKLAAMRRSASAAEERQEHVEVEEAEVTPLVCGRALQPPPPPRHAAPALLEALAGQPPPPPLEAAVSEIGPPPRQLPPPPPPSEAPALFGAVEEYLPPPPPAYAPTVGEPPRISAGLASQPIVLATMPPRVAPLLPPPGLVAAVAAAHAAPLSVGSELHGTGQCRPCAWFWKPQGCRNGKECLCCHLCEDGEIKARKKAKLFAMRSSATLSEQSTDSSQSLELPETASTSREELERHEVEEEEVEASSRCDCLDDLLKVGADTGGFQEQGERPEPTLPSRGSALHSTGQCVPCAWFWKSQGCQNGSSCDRCHMCPEGEVKARKKAKKAAMVVANRIGAEDSTISIA
mmetsp:Transcript_76397/g.169327  ORF Transcript_76397/g.169327 Transcript_76397/m.169327 type:complete len:501 (-) Transcript_76397:219-1721(-)